MSWVLLYRTILAFMLRAHSRHSVLLHSESNKHYFQLLETLAEPWSQHSSSTEHEGMVTTLTGARTSELPNTEGENVTGFARIKPRTDPKPTPCTIPSAPRMQPLGLRINLTRTGYRHTGAAQWVALGQAEHVGDCKCRHRSAAIQMTTGLLSSLYFEGKNSGVRDNRAALRGHPCNSTHRNTTKLFQTIYMR